MLIALAIFYPFPLRTNRKTNKKVKMSFYMYISSLDCKDIFEGNIWRDFTVQIDPELNFGPERDWQVALTDVYLVKEEAGGGDNGRDGSRRRIGNSSRRERIDDRLVKPIVICADVVTNSFMKQEWVPIVRVLPGQGETGGSLLLPIYVSVAVSRTNKVRIYILDEDLKPIVESDADWGEQDKLSLRCTLHFSKHHHE